MRSPCSIITASAACVAMAAWQVVCAQVPRMQHSPPSAVAAFQPITIDVVLAGEVRPERVASADVVVEQPDGGFRAFPLALSRNALFGEIPGVAVQPPRCRYYIHLVDADGETSTTPPGAPEGGLFSVAVTEVRRTAEAEEGSTWASDFVEILSPLPGEVVERATPTVAVIFVPRLDDPPYALVTLDGIDVTAAAELTPDALVFVPQDSLGDGDHRVTVSAIRASGTAEASWVFFVRERTAPDVGRPSEIPLEGEWSQAVWYEEAAGRPTSAWEVVGSVEVGWTLVAADTTKADSLDVFLTYEETSRPTLDFYTSGVSGERSFLLTAQYNPLFSDELDWYTEVRGLGAGMGARDLAIGVECGNIFPSLSQTTLDWASGLGAVLDARSGRTSVKMVGMRVSESDTLAGFGVYSRFALGAEGTFEWSDGLDASLIYVSVLDREESVPEEQRITDPLRNDIVAGVARARLGALRGELELAGSSSSGDYEGEGTCLRARAGLERSQDNRLFLEYVSASEDYYSAGTFENGPGEESLELEFAYRPFDSLRSSGWAEASRGGNLASSDEYGFKVYARAEFSWDAGSGQTRVYVVGRYDRTPYDDYDYTFSYGSLGGSLKRGPLRLLGSGSWSRARSPESTDTWSASGDVRFDVRPRFWTARVAVRWALGTGDGTQDYTRTQYTLESRWDLGDYGLKAEYWLIDRDDRAETEQSHTEQVVTVGMSRSF